MTRSQSPSLSSVSAGEMRVSAAWRSSSEISLRETCRVRLPLMVASPALMRSVEMSLSRTSIPASAHHMRNAVTHLTGADDPDLFD